MSKPVTGKTHVGEWLESRPNGDVYTYERVTAYNEQPKKLKLSSLLFFSLLYDDGLGENLRGASDYFFIHSDTLISRHTCKQIVITEKVATLQPQSL